MTPDVDLTLTGFVHYDAAGQVISRGNAAQVVVDAFKAQGQSILTVPVISITAEASAIREDDYVDLSGAAPALKARPTWPTALSPASVAPGVEATIPGLPACTVTFSGPVNGTQDHPGGDFAIGFRMPGTYQISFEVFPYMPITLPLTVAKSQS